MDLVSNGLKMLNHHFKTTIMNIEQNLITEFGQLKKGDVVLTNKGADLVVFKLIKNKKDIDRYILDITIDYNFLRNGGLFELIDTILNYAIL